MNTAAIPLRSAVAMLKEYRYPDEIAALLLDKGIRGAPGTGTKCPVAVFLRSEGNLASDDSLRVERDFIRYNPFTDEYPTTLLTPPVVSAFIRRFDAHEYPELIA